MTAQSEAHEKLVEEIAAISVSRSDGEEHARRILALIAERLSDVTPEMIVAGTEAPVPEDGGTCYYPGQAWEVPHIYRAMIAASPLTPGTSS